MSPPAKTSTATVSSFAWTSYRVSVRHKAPLLEFVLSGLREAGCRILWASPATTAPFYIVYEDALGWRQGILVYAFFANDVLTNGRPTDEHRFQIKYGSKLKGEVLRVAVDTAGLVATIFLGIDTEREIFVAVDPLMNNPSPMSRSVEFKRHRVDQIKDVGFAVWERDRLPGKTKDREAADLADLRTEILVGGTKGRLMDLIALERLAQGLDPGERHLLADKLFASNRQPTAVHPILSELDIEANDLLDLIAGASRLKMAVRGWVAETHLVDFLKKQKGVTECYRVEGDGRPDVSLRWRGGKPILIECKNTLRETFADGRPKVDFQRTRAAKGDPCSRYYSSSDFHILAACLHALTERWEFQFAATTNLEPHKKCPGKISSSIAVASPTFTTRPEDAFYICSHPDQLS